MKNFKLLFIMMAAVMFAVSCSEEEASIEDLSAKKATFYDTDHWDAIEFCGPVRYHDLIGGQDILMGSVAIGNTADTLYVKYQANPGYVITETHLFVGDVMDDDFPKTKKGNPQIGHFPYASEKLDGSTVVVYSISLDEIDGDCFDVAAHAVVECEDGSCEETAWGAGRKNELVMAAKIFLLEGGYSISTGVDFADECVLYGNFGYVTINIDEGLAGSAVLTSNSGEYVGLLNATIIDGNLEFVFESGDFTAIISQSHIFVGTLDDLLNTIDDFYKCPEYKEFPYNLGSSVSVNELPDVGSGEVKELSGVRWGYYFDYCLSSCDE
jgi:hypothetical protein